MSNYSNNPAHVRVDFFKPSGKWYTDEAVVWTGGYLARDVSIHEAFKESLKKHFEDRPNRLCEMDAICLSPYHEHRHPIQLKAGSWND